MMKNSFWQDRRVFVTGASGLVGGWLVEALLKEGADIVVLLRDWIPNSLLLQREHYHHISIIRGDLSQVKKLERILAEYEIKSVFHLAAQTIVPIANKNPLSTFESNIAGTWNLLEACRLNKGISSIIIASSDKAYGEAPNLPYNEAMPLNAIYPYDVSKACADRISVSYAKSFNLPIAITRCGNFFGGGDLNWNRVIPSTIRAVFRKKAPIIRSDGHLIRDYIYIEDAVSAYMKLCEGLERNSALYGEAFNFSNESQCTVLQLVQTILNLMHADFNPVILGENAGEITAQFLDSSKAHRDLNWWPRFTLEEGLKRTIAWYENYLGKKGKVQNELSLMCTE